MLVVEVDTCKSLLVMEVDTCTPLVVEIDELAATTKMIDIIIIMNKAFACNVHE